MYCIVRRTKSETRSRGGRIFRRRDLTWLVTKRRKNKPEFPETCGARYLPAYSHTRTLGPLFGQPASGAVSQQPKGPRHRNTAAYPTRHTLGAPAQWRILSTAPHKPDVTAHTCKKCPGRLSLVMCCWIRPLRLSWDCIQDSSSCERVSKPSRWST